jgi:hypothetical protein
MRSFIASALYTIFSKRLNKGMRLAAHVAHREMKIPHVVLVGIP